MFADPIRFWASTHPQRTAIVDRQTGHRYSYGDLDARITRAAALLHALGIGQGDRVGVLAMNRIEQIDLFYACHRSGAALVPLNWRLAAGELATIVADAALAVCFVEERFTAAATHALALVRTLPIDVMAAHDFTDAPAPLRNHAEDAALVLYTSGSTGKPKGAVLPHRQIFFNAIATTTAWQLTHADVAAITTPFFHTGGWNVFATPLWQLGGTIVLTEKFEPDDFLRVMAEEHCTVALTVPTQLQMLMEASSWGVELPSLRSFFSGGAPCPVSLLAGVRAVGYKIREGYGLTECGPNCFTISPDEAIAHPGVVGRPVPFLEMRTVDDGMNDVAAGEPGELLLRGPQLFAGYLNDPARTNEVLTADGWLRTGDLAVRNSAGAYRIAGRRKEMFISGGENVYPAEVEAVLCTCPGVAEVAVVGVSDARWGEVGRAFIVSRPGSSVSESDVLEFANTRLARYKLPRSVLFVQELPRLGSGKIDRQKLVTWP
jgi:fatty-acyl-CoA synthase